MAETRDATIVLADSAQPMQSTVTEAVVTSTELKIRLKVYIYAVFVFNLVVLTIAFEEAIRMVFWRELGKWNNMDIEAVIVSSWSGSRKIAETLSNKGGQSCKRRTRHLDFIVGK